MKKDKFKEKLIRRIAQISVGSSALRNQGAKGLIEICRDYFEEHIDIEELKWKLESDDFSKYLDYHTETLLKLFPESGKSWGAARKGLNLFFRGIIYNFYLANYLKIPIGFAENSKVIKNLEVPLDKFVALGIREKYPDLPKWKSIKSLGPDQSNLYQKKALEYAIELGIARVHLDLIFWRLKIKV